MKFHIPKVENPETKLKIRMDKYCNKSINCSKNGCEDCLFNGIDLTLERKEAFLKWEGKYDSLN